MAILQAQPAVGTKLLEVLTLLILAWIGGLGYSWRRQESPIEIENRYHEGNKTDKELEEALNREFKESIFMNVFLTFLLIFLNLMSIFVVDGLLALPGSRFEFALYTFLAAIFAGEWIYIRSSITPVNENAPKSIQSTVFGLNIILRSCAALVVIPDILYIGHLLGIFFYSIGAILLLVVIYLIYLFISRVIVESIFFVIKSGNENYVDINRLWRLSPKSLGPTDEDEIDLSIALLSAVSNKSANEVRKAVEHEIL